MAPFQLAVEASRTGLDGQDASIGLRKWIERYAIDRDALRRFYYLETSDQRLNRLEAFAREWQARLQSLRFETLELDQQIDYRLLANHLEFELRSLEHQRARHAASRTLLPFEAPILELEEERWAMEPILPRAAAEVLEGIRGQVEDKREELEAESSDTTEVSQVLAYRAARILAGLRRALRTWFDHYDAFDPEFAWWTRKPFEQADAALRDYQDYLRKELAGIRSEETDPLIGDPLGAEALNDEIRHELLPYGPEQLIVIGEREFAWCEQQMIAAAQELGFDQDWKAALEHVKNLHRKPGEQDELVAFLAQEAIDYLDQHDLVTIPDLCRETWRLGMIPPSQQKAYPFAYYGGQKMMLSFATADMEHEQKLMSMRGNNEHFTRAITHHELIPGHHLQGFMAARYRAYRGTFRTPFLVEGWALYWEMLLWDMGFARGPEDRIGMLFWRMHRAARIIVSLKFHLEQMDPQEMIEFLVDRVGHERDNATAEVRRFIRGDYGPLYQCAYMIGGLQLRALSKELVESGRMSPREFHDAILLENSIPIELLRAKLRGESPGASNEARWLFAGEI